MPPHSLFPQIATGFTLSLLSGLCSKVSLSGRPSLTTLFKMAPTLVSCPFGIPCPSSRLCNTYHLQNLGDEHLGEEPYHSDIGMHSVGSACISLLALPLTLGFGPVTLSLWFSYYLSEMKGLEEVFIISCPKLSWWTCFAWSKLREGWDVSVLLIPAPRMVPRPIIDAW